MSGDGPRVVILYEDKTAGGLHNLVRSIVAVRRADGRAPFAYFKHLAMKGNHQLVAECSNYREMRFRAPHRADHVIAVIDAHNVEAATGVKVRSWERHDPAIYREQCRVFGEEIRAVLRDRAMAGMAESDLAAEQARFWPIVLFWERESIFLAGGEVLRSTKRLVFDESVMTEDGVLATRNPADLVDKAWRAARRQEKKPEVAYRKQDDGPRLFGDLINHPDYWEKLLERVPSLREIVETLVAL